MSNHEQISTALNREVATGLLVAEAVGHLGLVAEVFCHVALHHPEWAAAIVRMAYPECPNSPACSHTTGLVERVPVAVVEDVES